MSSNDYDPLAAYLEQSLSQKIRALASTRSVRINFFLALFLIVATAILYSHSLWNPLVFDDHVVLNEGDLKSRAASFFQPGLRWLSYGTFGLTYKFFGTDWFWYRIGNLGLHALATVLLFAFFHRLLDIVLPQRDSALPHRWLAFFGALFFALHPVSVYGVAYLAERSIVMATLFGIAALLFYLEGLKRGGGGWFVGSMLFYFFAMSSKEHVVMLPGVAIAISLLLRKPSLSQTRKFWPSALILAGIGLLFALHYKGHLGTAYEPTAFEIFSQMRRHGMGPNLDNAYPLSIITQSHLFFEYLLLWLVPYTGWMSIDIRQPFATGYFVWPQTAGFIAFLIYPVVAARFLFKGGRQGLVGLGMLFPWILFLTEFSLVRVSEIFVLYRSYLWMSGLPLVLVALLSTIRKKTAAALLASMVCLVLFPLAWNRLDTFSDHIRLWSDAIESNRGKMNQGAERAYYKRGLAYTELDRYQDAIRDFKQGNALHSSGAGYANIGDIGVVYFQANYLIENALDRESIQKLTKTVELQPDSAEAYLNRGLAYLRLFKPGMAEKDFTKAIRRDSGYTAEALRNRAIIYSRVGEPLKALSDLDKAIELDPKFAKAYMNRGVVRAMRGHFQTALDDLDKAVRLDPKDAEIHFNRGNVHVIMRRYEDALKDFSKAIECDAKTVDAYVNRGAIYMQFGRLPEAMAEFGKALEVNPDNENAYLNRAKIHMALSRKQEAMSDYEKVLNLNHQNAEALLNRGILLLDQKQVKEAKISFKRSCDAGNMDGCERLREIGR